MANLALVTNGHLSTVESIVQRTLTAAEAIAEASMVRLDTATGKATPSNGTTAPEARVFGIALRAAAAGEPVTIIRLGLVDGLDLSALGYDADVFLSDTDGRLADAAGTVSKVIGKVIPGNSTLLGTAADKLLSVNCL